MFVLRDRSHNLTTAYFIAIAIRYRLPLFLNSYASGITLYQFATIFLTDDEEIILWPI